MNLPSVTDKDREFIEFACDNDIDFIAHSFVRNKQDILAVQKILDQKNSGIKIIAKIENTEGVENIEEILDLAYGIMIARGDMGIELPAEDVPVVQKKIIKACIRRAKPVITATQMLHSMITNPRPTRAEVSDVANAILDGTDAVMLSGETAYGKYPLEAVRTMSAIAKRMEEMERPITESRIIQPIDPVRFQLIKCAIESATALNVKAVIVHTISGRSARLLSAYRGETPIKALCVDANTVRHLGLSRGVEACQMEYVATIDELVHKSCTILQKDPHISRKDLLIMLAESPGKTEMANFLEIGTMEMFSHSY